MYYRYGKKNANWDDSKKIELAKAICDSTGLHFGYWPGKEPYLDIGEEVIIKRTGGMSTEEEKKLVYEADRLYKEIMKK